MGLYFKTFLFFSKTAFYIFFWLENLNPLKLRDQWGYSEASKIAWIGLCDSISQETKTAHKISSSKDRLDETK